MASRLWSFGLTVLLVQAKQSVLFHTTTTTTTTTTSDFHNQHRPRLRSKQPNPTRSNSTRSNPIQSNPIQSTQPLQFVWANKTNTQPQQNHQTHLGRKPFQDLRGTWPRCQRPVVRQVSEPGTVLRGEQFCQVCTNVDQMSDFRQRRDRCFCRHRRPVGKDFHRPLRLLDWLWHGVVHRIWPRVRSFEAARC